MGQFDDVTHSVLNVLAWQENGSVVEQGRELLCAKKSL
jgi:hypothetical protein